jgi:hypothetical protein
MEPCRNVCRKGAKNAANGLEANGLEAYASTCPKEGFHDACRGKMHLKFYH